MDMGLFAGRMVVFIPSCYHSSICHDHRLGDFGKSYTLMVFRCWAGFVLAQLNYMFSTKCSRHCTNNAVRAIRHLLPRCFLSFDCKTISLYFTVPLLNDSAPDSLDALSPGNELLAFATKVEQARFDH